MKYKKGDKLVCIKFFDWGDDRIYYPNNFYEIYNIIISSDLFIL